jgi:hypothetical protein
MRTAAERSIDCKTDSSLPWLQRIAIVMRAHELLRAGYVIRIGPTVRGDTHCVVQG